MNTSLGANCRAGCPTKNHRGFGECARAADLQIDRHGLAGHRPAEAAKDRRLDRYESLRAAGVQPAGTTWPKIRAAEEHGGI